MADTPRRPDPLRGWPTRRWHCYYMGRFPVPDWLYAAAPVWMHEAADWLGGVEPSPWAELWDEVWDEVWGRIVYSRPVCLIYRIVTGRDRV